ncbi:MAG: hypothetical protein HY216_05340 [Candidatus Rokubacteria bacterium]|nr:hypothetical protein [Candidatus Rokubacteria bacterium]
MDGVLLLGLLHHLDDPACHELLGRIVRVLAPGGRVVTVDTCFDESQGVVSRLMSYGDRGHYVRPGRAFDELARAHFAGVDSRLAADVCRVPGAYWIMRLTGPLSPR